MFHCAEGHQAGPGRKMTRVPIVVRVVQNEHYEKDPHTGASRHAHTSISKEIVEEGKFCPDHVAEAKNLPPMVLGSDKNPDTIRRHSVEKRWDFRRQSYRYQEE